MPEKTDNSTPLATAVGNTVRFEMVLTPEQMGNLLKVVATTNHSILTPREAAHYLRLTVAKVEDMAERGRLPGFRVDGTWRFTRATLDEWIQASQVEFKEAS